MKLKITLFFLLISFLNIYGQDPFYTQFYHAPLILNPALTGTNDGADIGITFRNQAISLDNGYRTASVAYDQPIKLNSGDQIGVGGQIVMEQSGSSKLRNVNVSLLLSYQKKIFKESNNTHFLIGGLQLGGAHRVIADFENLRFGNQHDGNGGFDPTISPGVDLRDRFMYLDIGGGVAWKIVFANKNKLIFGRGFHHLNRPNQSFINNSTSNLYIRHTTHLTAEIRLLPSIAFLPRFFIMERGPSFQATIMPGFKIALNKENDEFFEIAGGVRLANHVTDGVAISSLLFGLNFSTKKFRIGVSSDFNQGSYSAINGGYGWLELALGYRFSKKNLKIDS